MLRWEQGSEVAGRPSRLAAGCGGLNGKRAPTSREARTTGVEKALKTEPQERHRGEIDPDGVAGRKPSRACETPRTEGGGQWQARGDRTRDSSNAVGA